MRRQADFARVFRSGQHHSGRLMAVRSAPNDLALSRYACSVSKRVGNAVVRNRVRRRVREAMRVLPLIEGYDIVVVARPEAARSDFPHLREELTRLMRRGKLLEQG